jgi:hypothetical protein
MAVVVPAVLAETPVLEPVPCSSTPVPARRDRAAAWAFSPDLPPPRA